jgi:hypothetical protein
MATWHVLAKGQPVRLRRWIKIGGLMFIGMAATVATNHAFRWREAQRALDIEIAKIRERGEPLTVDDLIRSSDSPAVQRGTAFYSVLERLKPLSADEHEVLENHSPTIPIDPQTLEFAIDRNREVLDEASRLLRTPAFCAPVAWNRELPSDTMLPHLTLIRDLVRLQRAQCLHALATDNDETAVASLVDMFRASRALTQEQCMLDHLVRLAIIQETIDLLAQSMPELAVDAKTLHQIDEELRCIDADWSLAIAVLGERAASYTLLRQVGKPYMAVEIENRSGYDADGNSRTADWTNRLANWWMGSVFHRPALLRQQALLLQSYSELAATIDGTGPDDVSRFFIATDEVEILEEKHVLLNLVGLAYDAFAWNARRARQRLVSARLGIRICHARSQTGVLPSELTQVLDARFPEVPLGYISATPLHYKRGEAEFEISDDFDGLGGIGGFKVNFSTGSDKHAPHSAALHAE